MTSNIPSGICQTCFTLCEQKLTAACNIFANATVQCGRSYTSCGDKTIHRTGNHPTIYCQFKEMVENNPTVSFRDLADYDQEVFECCILPNLVAAILVNKCIPCMTTMYDTHLHSSHTRQSDVYTLPIVFFIDKKTLTPIPHEEMSCHNPQMYETTVADVACTYYEPTVFHMFVTACMEDNFTKSPFSGWLPPDPDMELIRRFPVSKVALHLPDVFTHFITIIKMQLNSEAGHEYYCLKFLKDHNNPRVCNVDMVRYCKQHLSQQVFEDVVHDYLEHLDPHNKKYNHMDAENHDMLRRINEKKINEVHEILHA
jgi:hypothetical protein